ncbi:MAG TPA: carbohydrate kinase family protein [Gaiellaceae bacterium]|nr:carbohydrate kinase family protein [Gaiellaceae bacterium]
MRIVTFGDLLLDVVVRLDTELVPGDDQPAHTATGPGGQAANVAAWAAALGAEATFVGRVGADPAGGLVLHELAQRGVTHRGPVAGRTGVVVSIAAAGDRTMASDRGTAPELAPQDLEPAWFHCDVLHVSGYALAREPIASAADAAVEHARTRSATVSLDVSAWTLVDDAFRARVASLAPDLVFATEREQAAIGSLDTRWVLKRGARGLRVDGADHPAVGVEVVDTTGAGDALAAGFLVGGPELGTATAARCCARMGAMP